MLAVDRYCTGTLLIIPHDDYGDCCRGAGTVSVKLLTFHHDASGKYYMWFDEKTLGILPQLLVVYCNCASGRHYT